MPDESNTMTIQADEVALGRFAEIIRNRQRALDIQAACKKRYRERTGETAADRESRLMNDPAVWE